MPKPLLFLLLLLATSAQAQITGRVEDTIARKPLHLAVASLINVKDSVLVSFARTNEQGQFRLPAAPPGRYLLRLSYPGYAAYSDVVELPASGVLALNKLPLLTKEKVLEEVIVKQKVAAMRLKGDTIEYVADSFKVDANASVEELLKRLPGIQVNGKGEIVAQGQKVEKILVDGEEFFSDDPAVVSKNLRADAVDKLQVFDKKSDQAAFTGVDDGQTTKTINLSLKDNAKKGYFGKAEAGTDFQNYYRGKLLANAFQAKRKIAGYLTGDNTQFQSLNWDEREKYSTDADRSVQVGDDGSVWMYSNGDEWSQGQGLPKALSGGFLFSNKWAQDKHNLNLNYQMNDQRVQGSRSSITQTLLPDTSFTNRTNSLFSSNRQRHRAFGTYEWTIDSTSSLKTTARATTTRSDALQRYLGQSISQDGRIINNSDRTTTGRDNSQQFDANLFYRKRFAKAGRTISLNLDAKHNTAEYDGYLLAANQFFDKLGNPVLNNNVDQNKNSSSYQTVATSKAVYTEPLVAKKLFLELSAAYATSRNDAERNTLEKPGGAGDKYSLLIDSLSNHFIFNTNAYSGGTSLRFTGKKITASAGAQLGQTIFKQKDVRLRSDRQIGFTNFLPQANFEFRPKKQTRMNLSYNGSNTNPSLNQIQPILDNSDPLNLTIGNPNLRQSFTHSMRLSFSDYKVLKGRNIWASLNGSTTNNAITSANFVDSLGRRLNQFVNVNGNYNVNGYITIGKDIGKGLNVSAYYEPSLSRYANFVNNRENITRRQNQEFGINSGYWGDFWLNYWLGASATYNRSVSSINPDLVTRYWSYQVNPNLTFKYKKKWVLEVNGNLQMYQRTEAFANQQDFYIVNANLKRFIGKKNQWEIGLVVNDVFNQNVGFRRDISTNFISESSWQQVQRFGLLTLAYNFTKNSAQASN